jgi:hypothetical protein
VLERNERDTDGGAGVKERDKVRGGNDRERERERERESKREYKKVKERVRERRFILEQSSWIAAMLGRAGTA